MEIEGVIFDLDGTLVHTIEDIAGSANEMFARNGMPGHPVSHYLEWVVSGAVKLIERAHGGKLERDQLLAYVAEFKEIYGENLHNRSRVYDGIPDLLDALVNQGLKLSILSNKPHLLTLKVVAYYLSGWPFHPVFGQRDEVPRKPDPAAALEIARWMDEEPARILFVGDSENDILTARAAGMIPLGVSWGYGRLETGAFEGECLIIDRPSDLVAFIENHQ
jgi:phosphoglycolate phosphatase